MSAKQRKCTMVCAVLMLFMTRFCAAAGPAFAEDKDMNNMPVTAEICLERIVEGDAAKAGEDAFVLKAEDPSEPMPEGSEEGAKTITVRGAGTRSFGEITFQKPDVYLYSVSRVRNDRSNVRKDYEEYTVKAAVLNSGEVSLITMKSNGKKSAITYRDAVGGSAVKTGDFFDPVRCGMLCGAAMAGALSLLAARRRKRYGVR